jgi:VWFA-related protein
MRTRLSTAACLLLAVAALTAQDPPTSDGTQLPTFRTQADAVRLDMYATRGRELVTDLRAADVEVLEDGVRQRIDTFEFVRIPGVVSSNAADGALLTPEAVPVSQDTRSRVFVVFVDTHTTRLESNDELRRGLLRFLDQLLGPTDLVGLMTPEMLASDLILGRRSTVISDLANDDRWTSPDDRRPDPREFAWENCYGLGRRGGSNGGSRSGNSGGGGGGGSSIISQMRARYQARSTIEALADLVTHLRLLREERKAVLLVTAGWPFPEDANTTTPGRAETEACAKDRGTLARTDFGQLLRELGRTANRANVSFYPVSSRRALEIPRDMPGAYRQQMQSREAATAQFIETQLRRLAAETDGLAEVKATDLSAVTERIISDTSAYYLIGYQSTNTKTDRRFRAITVKINRPGVVVRARAGYGGEAPAPRVLPTIVPPTPVVDSRITSAMIPVERFDALAPFWGRPSTWHGDATGGGGFFWYVGELGPQTRTESPWKSGTVADVEVVATDKTTFMTHSVDLNPSDSRFVLRVPPDGSLPAGSYSVRVRLKPKEGEALAVHDTVRVTLEPSGSAIGEAMFWRRGPSSRSSYVETADPRFRRTERMRLELPTTASDPATARLLDRAGRPLQVPAEVSPRADASGGFQWLGIDAPLTVLAPGDYAVEVTQNGSSRITAFRVIP